MCIRDSPYSMGIGDLSIIELDGNGGGLTSNINRWRRQLNLDSISLEEIEENISLHKGLLGEFKIIEIIDENTNNAFLCAILFQSNSSLFIKLSIQSNGIYEVKNDFISFITSIK